MKNMRERVDMRENEINELCEESCPPCPRAAAEWIISPSVAPARRVPGSSPGLHVHASRGENILSLNTLRERGMFVRESWMFDHIQNVSLLNCVFVYK